MAYKNIDVSELGLRQKIQYKSSRFAFFVPRLLAKLAKKVILNPITKVVSGMSYEDAKFAAQQGVMAYQSDMADEMQPKIDEGMENLEAWKNDREYYIGNVGKYKSYQSTIDDLVKKQAKLRKSPKKLLVASTYVNIMKMKRKERKEEKKTEKLVKSIVIEYQQQQENIKNKQLELAALRDALAKSERDLATMQKDLSIFESENSDIIDQINNQGNLDQMDSFAQTGATSKPNPNAMEQYGLTRK